MPTCQHCGGYATYGDGWSSCDNCEGGPRELPEEFEVQDDEEEE